MQYKHENKQVKNKGSWTEVHVNRQTVSKLCSQVNGFILDVPIGTPQLNIVSTTYYIYI